MKKLVILSVILLAGCMAVPKFDTNEFKAFADIKADSVVAKEFCGDDKVKNTLPGLRRNAQGLVALTQYPESNKETFESAKLIEDLVKDLVERYKNDKPSTVYCQLKFDNIIEATDVVLKSLGKRRPTNDLIDSIF